MTDDRPVSLAAVEELIRAREFAFASDDGFRRALSDVRALPTFAPATPDAPKSVEEMADAIGTILPCPFCGSSADHRGEAAYVRCTNLSCETMGPCDDPTGSKWNAVPRGLPAPVREWTGPDSVQACFESVHIACPGETAAPDGFVAVGPWEPGNVWLYPDWQTPQGETIPMPVRDWRRPLRRVQP